MKCLFLDLTVLASFIAVAWKLLGDGNSLLIPECHATEMAIRIKRHCKATASATSPATA